jgi:hypothetical protein
MLDYMRLIRRSDVSGSLYFELQPGAYAGECWRDESVYVKEEVFAYLEVLVARHVPAFSHWAFTDVSREQWIPLLQDLAQFADGLDTAREMDDVRGELGSLFTDSKEQFAADFDSNARALAALIRDLVAWVNEQLKTHDGVAILGI